MTKQTLSILSLVVFILCSCGKSSPQETTTTTDSTALVISGVPDSTQITLDGDVEASFSAIKHFANYSEDFQLLITSLEGLFRGTSLGITKDQVKKLETDMGQLTKETANELNYKASLGEGETATISYKFKDNKLHNIMAEVRVKEIADYEALNSELVDYYQTKFGNMQLDNMQETWKINDTHTIKVQDIEKTKTDFYILIEVK
jgi:hypothetical protein